MREISPNLGGGRESSSFEEEEEMGYDGFGISSESCDWGDGFEDERLLAEEVAMAIKLDLSLSLSWTDEIERGLRKFRVRPKEGPQGDLI